MSTCCLGLRCRFCLLRESLRKSVSLSLLPDPRSGSLLPFSFPFLSFCSLYFRLLLTVYCLPFTVYSRFTFSPLPPHPFVSPFYFPSFPLPVFVSLRCAVFSGRPLRLSGSDPTHPHTTLRRLRKRWSGLGLGTRDRSVGERR